MLRGCLLKSRAQKAFREDTFSESYISSTGKSGSIKRRFGIPHWCTREVQDVLAAVDTSSSSKASQISASAAQYCRRALRCTHFSSPAGQVLKYTSSRKHDMCPWLSSAATHEQTAQTWPRLCWAASRYDDGVAFSVFAGVYGKLAEIAFASETSLRHTRCTRVLCRRWDDTKQPLASWSSSEDDSIPGIRHTKATHIDCFVKKKKNLTQRKQEQEMMGMEQSRFVTKSQRQLWPSDKDNDLPCIAYELSAIHNAFLPPKPLSTFRAFSMMTSIEQSSMGEWQVAGVGGTRPLRNVLGEALEGRFSFEARNLFSFQSYVRFEEFFCFPRFWKIWRQTFMLWSFWFRRGLAVGLIT